MRQPAQNVSRRTNLIRQKQVVMNHCLTLDPRVRDRQVSSFDIPGDAQRNCAVYHKCSAGWRELRDREDASSDTNLARRPVENLRNYKSEHTAN